MNNPLPRLRALYDRTTPRQRKITLYVAFALLTAMVAWSTYRLFFPPAFDYAHAVFTRDFTTDNDIHPVFLPADEDDTHYYDALAIQNLGQRPLALFAFTTRPRGAAIEQTMSSWALWIAKTKQAVTVEPGHTWVINPNDLDTLPFLHGRTWLAVFYEPLPGDHTTTLPSSFLPPSFKGTFRVYFLRSGLSPDLVALPQLHREAILGVLRTEADLTNKRYYQLPPLSLIGRNGLTPAELR